jgi:hypothetical protein
MAVTASQKDQANRKKGITVRVVTSQMDETMFRYGVAGIRFGMGPG